MKHSPAHEEKGMYRRWTFKYSVAAGLAAIAIIAISLLASAPTTINSPAAPGANFAVLLTDPPTVPAGTTQLNMTYNSLMLHVTYLNGSAEWLPVSASGTVDLFTLINVTQTIAKTTIPVNSTVDRVQFTIQNVTAKVNSVDYNVTVLSNTFVVKVANAPVNQTVSGVLIDFNPTLVQIQAFDQNATTVYYYMLVPSANAVIVNNVTQEQLTIGRIVKIGDNNRVTIERIKENFSKNLTTTSATLFVKGNSTSLSVTLENQGNISFRIVGLTLHGEFNVTQTFIGKHGNREDNGDGGGRTNPNTIPFKVSGTSLVPILGGHENDDEQGFSSVTIQPGQSITLSFSGVISYGTSNEHGKGSISSIAPIVGGNYTLRLSGEGFQTFTVEATAQP